MTGWYILGVVLFTPLAAIHWYLIPKIRHDAKFIRRAEFLAVTAMLSILAVVSVLHLAGAKP